MPRLSVDQTVDPPVVTTDQEFTYTINITNPNDCIVTALKLVETTTPPAGVTIEVVSTTPGGSQAGGAVTFSDLGTLGPNETKTIKIRSKVPLGSAEGLIKALAVAEGVCPVEVVPPADTDGPETPGTPETGSDIPVRGEDAVDGPNVDTCVVPRVQGLPLAEATRLIIDAGCDVGKVTEDPGAGEDDEGKVTDQTPDDGTSVPRGTDVDIAVGGDLCTVPSVIGTSIAEAENLLISQTPGADAVVPRNSNVTVDIGVQVLGETLTGQEVGRERGAAPTLARTGGVFLGGLALWLLVGGLVARSAGSKRLWRLARRRDGRW